MKIITVPISELKGAVILCAVVNGIITRNICVLVAYIHIVTYRDISLQRLLSLVLHLLQCYHLCLYEH